MHRVKYCYHSSQLISNHPFRLDPIIDTVYEKNFYNSLVGFDNCHKCKYSILMTSSRAFRFCSPLMLKGVIEVELKSISPSDWFYPLVLFQSSYELAISRALGRCPDQFYPWVLANISFGDQPFGRVLHQAGLSDYLTTAESLNTNLNDFLNLSGKDNDGGDGVGLVNYAYRTGARTTDPLNFMFNSSDSSLYNSLSVDDNFLAYNDDDDDDNDDDEDDDGNRTATDADNNESIMFIDDDGEYGAMLDQLEKLQENNFFASVLSYGLGFNHLKVIGSVNVSSQPANPFYGPKWSIFYPLIQTCLIRDDAEMMKKIFRTVEDLYCKNGNSEYLHFKVRVIELFFIAAVNYNAFQIYKDWLLCALSALSDDTLKVVDRIAGILHNQCAINWIERVRESSLTMGLDERYKTCDDMYSDYGINL